MDEEKKKKEFKIAPIEFKGTDEEDMSFEAYVAVFGNEDSWGDIIVKGAFKKDLKGWKKKGKFPKFLYQHRSAKVPGVITDMKENDVGLLIKGHFIGTTLGKDAYLEAKSGAVDQFSFGFYAVKYEIDNKTYIRTLMELKIFEASQVTFPANDKTKIVDIKATIEENVRVFEGFLRDEGGFSQKDAKTIISKGYKSFLDQRDVDPEKNMIELCKSLENLNKTLKGDN